MSYLNKFFKSRAKQAKAESLFAEVKAVKSEYDSWAELDTDFIFFLDSIKAEYQNKKVIYLKFLDLSYYTSQHHIHLLSNFEHPNKNSLELATPSRRILILERLITLCDLIIQTGDSKAMSEVKELEILLANYLNKYESIYLSIYGVTNRYYISEIKKELKSKLSSLRSQLRFLFKSKFHPSNIRDLRQSYRCLVKILFKNMDDEASALIVVETPYSKTINSTQTFHSNGKQRKSRSFNET